MYINRKKVLKKIKMVGIDGKVSCSLQENYKFPKIALPIVRMLNLGLLILIRLREMTSSSCTVKTL
jgi:hypothetical protein